MAKLEYETIYRVKREVVVDEDHFTDEVVRTELGLEEGAEVDDIDRRLAAYQTYVNKQPEDVYYELFEPEVQSGGQVGFYYKVIVTDNAGELEHEGQGDDSDYDAVKQTL